MSNMSAVRLVIFDLDGTLYMDGEPIAGAIETINALRKKELLVRFMTNTSTKTREILHEELTSMGFNIEPEELITAPRAACLYLRQKQQNVETLKIWPVVSESVVAEFTEFEVDEAQPNYVVIGDIADGWNLALINKIFKVMHQGAKLIALHKNKFWQKQGELHVDIGFFIAGLEFVTAQQAEIIGKPARLFFQQVLESADCLAGNALLIGDDIDSDIGGAQAAGISTVLVKTGKYREYYAQASLIKPDAVIDSVASLNQLLDQSHG